MSRTFVCQGCNAVVLALHGSRIKCSCGVTSAAELLPPRMNFVEFHDYVLKAIADRAAMVDAFGKFKEK